MENLPPPVPKSLVPKNGQPRPESPGRGCLCCYAMNRQEDPVSRILSCAVIPLDAASPRTFISDLPGGFGVLRTAAPRGALYPWILQSNLTVPGRHRCAFCSKRALPPYLVLLRVGFTLPRTLQPGRCALTAPFHPYLGVRPASWSEDVHATGKLRGLAGAVCFLWHWPSMGLEAHVPDVIRHTALRSSDFPPPEKRACARPPAATARSSCQLLV